MYKATATDVFNFLYIDVGRRAAVRNRPKTNLKTERGVCNA